MIQAVHDTGGTWYRRYMVHAVHGTDGIWYRRYMVHAVHGTGGTWYRRYMVQAVHGTADTPNITLSAVPSQHNTAGVYVVGLPARYIVSAFSCSSTFYRFILAALNLG